MQQPNYYSRPQQRQYEPGTITGRRGPAEGFTRMAIVAVVSAVIAYMFVTVMRDYDAATYHGPTQGDGWQNRNHTGITPYGYPAGTAGPPRGRQECTYDGRRLACGPRQTPPTTGRPQGMHLDPLEVDEIDDRRGDPSPQMGPAIDMGPPQPGVPYPRWRDCWGQPNGPHECGPWHQGTP